jgi:hypothetical protein
LGAQKTEITEKMKPLTGLNVQAHGLKKFIVVLSLTSEQWFALVVSSLPFSTNK